MSTLDITFIDSGAFCPSREAGPHIPECSTSELEYFNLYIDDSVIKMLVTATNDYAEQKKNSRKHMYRRFKQFPLTEDEMQRYLGALILFSIS